MGRFLSILFHRVCAAVACALTIAAAPQAASSEQPIRIGAQRTPGPFGGNDNVATTYRSAAADTTILASYTFDIGPSCSNERWKSVDRTAGTADFGDYAALYPALSLVQQDLCSVELDCVWAFLEGSTANYACGGFPSQATVPYGAGGAAIHNEIWSPPIHVAGTGSQFELSFSVYRELNLESLVFYTWRIRSVADGMPGPWSDRGTVFYGPNAVIRKGDWFRHTAPFGDLVEPGADSVQVALGVVDRAADWGGLLGDGSCHSHTPLFDDVRVYRVHVSGPRWYVEPIDLFQDSFPGDGTATGTVRVDIARDILPRASGAIRPGDSLVVQVGDPEDGLDYHSGDEPASGPAVYLHVRDASPSKSGAAITGDETRWPVASVTRGWTTLRLDSVRTPAGPAAGRFCVDLNDALYTPGDTIQFYLSARSARGVTTWWSEFTGATASEGEVLARPMEMTCLPLSGNSPRMLYVDHDDGGSQGYFDTAFEMLAINDIVDRYDVRGPDQLAGNGPGSRVTGVAEQLTPFYNVIIWCSGTLPRGTIGDGTGRPEKSADTRLLADFLTGLRRPGGVYLTGDNLAGELAEQNGGGAAALRTFIDYTIGSRDHTQAHSINPYGVGEPGSIFSDAFGHDTLVVYGGCPIVDAFDVLAPGANSTVEMNYDGNNSIGGAVVKQESLSNIFLPARVVLSGFSFEHIRDAWPSEIPARAVHLHAVLSWLVIYNPPPCAQPFVHTERVSSGVKITWGYDEICYDLTAFRIVRNTGGEDTEIGVAEAETREFTDPRPVAGSTSVYHVYGEIEGQWAYDLGSSTIVVEELPEVPRFELGQNAPNPSGPGTVIPFSIPVAGFVNLVIYDAGGREVLTLLNNNISPAGTHEITWDGTRAGGDRAASGVYFYRITTGGESLVRKMVLLR
jgi:hypothetical protein